MIALGIDPGLKHCGLAVLKDGRHDHSSIQSFANLNEFRDFIHQAMSCDNEPFDVIGIEDWLYRGASKGDSSITVPKMVGVVIGISIALSRPVVVLPTDTWKYAITSKKRPTDTEIQKAVELQLNHKFPTYKFKYEWEENFHAIEACAIALAASRRNR